VAEFEPALRELVARNGLTEAKVLNRVIRHLEPVFTHYVPRAVEEIRGMAEGAELSFERAFFAAVRDGLYLPYRGENIESEGELERTAEGECTAFFCGLGTTREGNILIGQTKDNSTPPERYHVMHWHYSDGRSVIVLNYPGWCANICMTSDGLSFTGNSLAAAAPAGETIPISLIKRLVIEKKALSEVLACLDGLRFPPGCLLMADVSGHGVCVESAGGHLDVRDISGHAYGHANSVLADSLQVFARPPVVNSTLRQKNIQRLLREKCGSLSVEAMKTITTDHTDYPNSICRHAARDDRSTTTAAFITDLTNLEMHVAVGNPCVASYRSYRIPGTGSSGEADVLRKQTVESV
jgi:isopenicillin-N N-acyltransferase-like protein